MPRRIPVVRAPASNMAMRMIVLSSDYGYVAAVGASSALLLIWQSSMVARKRKLLGIPYPKMYDEKSNEFNCTQRGHQNTLENYPQFLMTLFLGGLEYPRAAAVLGGCWVLGRAAYMLGYSTGNPKHRIPGFGVSMLSQIGLLGLSISVAVRLLRGV